MKFITALLLTMLLGYIVYLFNNNLPWWMVTLGPFLAAAAVPQKPWQSWLAGFSGIFLLWGLLAWWIDRENAGVMSARMAQVLPFQGSRPLLLLVTALTGGILGGFAALTGAFLRKKPA